MHKFTQFSDLMSTGGIPASNSN